MAAKTAEFTAFYRPACCGSKGVSLGVGGWQSHRAKSGRSLSLHAKFSSKTATCLVAKAFTALLDLSPVMEFEIKNWVKKQIPP